ncbi:MAG: isoprenylcysteine carboxylmethyltransferase family protein, partial [Acetobacteraceae bacterium]|nr:isoprenylcysteine carboxylmethyltransferase family protein [Acetobacteraceae bacterium]
AAAGWAGVAAMGLGTALLAWAQRAMGTSWRVGIDAAPTALVATGPFAVSRNPAFLGFLLLFAGAALSAPGLLTAGALGAALVSFPAQVRLEEAHLAAQHGAAWHRYAALVPRWLGRRPRAVPP